MYTTNLKKNSTELKKPFSYIQYTGCVFEHILYSKLLTNREKLFYLIADSLSYINKHNNSITRSVSLSSNTWAKKLNCSKSEVFILQKSLEKKEYFVIIRDTNKQGKNKRNIIVPTIPNKIFLSLVKEPNKFTNILSMFVNNIPAVNRREYLEQNKLYIKLNYQIIRWIISSITIKPFAKVIWLDFYNRSYKNNIKCSSKNENSFNCIVSYKELEKLFECSKDTISRTLVFLEKEQLIEKKQFFIKNDDKSDNLHDKSLWKILINVPSEYQQFFDLLRNPKYLNEKYDPYHENSNQYYNKNLFKKDLDNLDKKDLKLNKKIFSSKSLKSFFPLTEQQAKKINNFSKKHYSLNYINNLLLKLHFHDTNKKFSTENHMLSYMKKALTFEKTNNYSNKTYSTQIERFLSTVESSSNTDDISRIKRKIAAHFEQDIAYMMLTKINFYISNQKSIILTQSSEFLTILQKNVLKKIIYSVCGFIKVKFQIFYHLTKNDSSLKSKIVEEKQGIWNEISKILQFELGVFTYQKWIQDLQFKEFNNKIELIASSPLYRDWVTNNYSHIIKRCCKNLGYDFLSIICIAN